MSDETPRRKVGRTTNKSIEVEWSTPVTRAQRIYRHEVTCGFCGRHFTIETLQPISPKFCLKADNLDCYRRRKAAYIKSYRERKKDE